MNLKIGKKEFTVDRIIYVSPNGNDNNNGLSKSAPLLTLKYAIEYIISLGGGAICFMRGVHDFTDQCFYQSDDSNNYFIKDFDNTKSVPIIFYSESPKYTEIHLIKTYLIGYNRTQFISLNNSNSKLINLNIFFKCDVAEYETYSALFTGEPSNVLITNCIFNIDIKNWSNIPVYVESHGGTCKFDNCVFNTGNIVKHLTGNYCTYNNCVFQTNPINGNGTTNNCYINSNINDMSINELLNLKDDNGNKVGVSNSDYSMWNEFDDNNILIQKTLISNVKNINLNNKIFNLIFTDNNNLYITDSENNLIKIIHNHDNISILNKLSVDNNKNLLYNNKKVPFKDILTTEDIKNINANIF